MVVVTGAAGLVGSTVSRRYALEGELVVGIDNDQRGAFFGTEASTSWSAQRLAADLSNYRHVSVDIRDVSAIENVFREYSSDIELVVHAAAQPSHDWSAGHPTTDFEINAVGTLNVLNATRVWAPDAVFVFTSTNKVYGDRPNFLPLVELEQRWEVEASHAWSDGIGEEMSIDATTHSIFGASKAAADLLVQEYGRYFGMKTTVLRAGCLTGPAHAGTELHGFLAYLMKSTVLGTPYRVYGYKAKQVRDNLHAADLADAFDAVRRGCRAGEAYNIGGGRFSNCSMLEAIALCEKIAGRSLNWVYDETPRRGDHIWWISGTQKFSAHFPQWKPQRSIEDILVEIHDEGVERWRA